MNLDLILVRFTGPNTDKARLVIGAPAAAIKTIPNVLKVVRLVLGWAMSCAQVYYNHACLLLIVFVFSQWGAANAEMKVPSAQSTQLLKVLF